MTAKYRWFLFKWRVSPCVQCEPRETEFSLRNRPVLTVRPKGMKERAPFDRWIMFGNKESGARKPYVCEHGKVCHVTMLGVRKFVRSPCYTELNEAKKEMGYVSQD